MMDKIFRALSNPSRRKILDIVKNNPGININQLSDYFDFTRFSIMKHLKILEDANLLIPKRFGKFKNLYINIMPIQMVYDRWISNFSAHWAKRLSSFKYSLEKEKTMMSDKKPSHIFVVYIQTTKEKLWGALTHSDITKQYYYGSIVKSNFQKGSKIEYWIVDENGEEKVEVYGEILEIVPYKRLAHSFNFRNSNDPPSRVTYEIEEIENAVKLILTHDQFESETETYKSTHEGWSFILSGMKTFLETGKSLS